MRFFLWRLGVRLLACGGGAERRARDSNPQPVSRHDISSVAASHSLTLRKSTRRGSYQRKLIVDRKFWQVAAAACDNRPEIFARRRVRL